MMIDKNLITNMKLVYSEVHILSDNQILIVSFITEANRLIEPRHEKTNVLHMQKQRRRSASR